MGIVKIKLEAPFLFLFWVLVDNCRGPL